MRELVPLRPVEYRAESLTDIVYASIRDAIVTKQLSPGERISEARLAAALRVSKTPVREAILRLQEIGLIEAESHRGHRVVSPSPAAFAHAFELREALETFTAAKAAREASTADRTAISAAADASLRAAGRGDIDGFRAADRTFHDAIATAASNPRVTKAIDGAVALIGALRERDLPDAEAAAACAASHVSIARAIRRRDADRAAQLMRAHLGQVRDYIAVQI